MGLEYSEKLGRKLRRGSWEEVGVSDFTKISEAIAAGRKEEARELVEYLRTGTAQNLRFEREWISAFLTDMANEHGEDVVYEMWRFAGRVVRPPYEQIDPDQPPEHLLTLYAEMARALDDGPIDRRSFEITETADRYVVTLDPCPTGGAMRREAAATGNAPYLGRTQRAYPWSWGRSGVPYYCTHCAIVSEIMAIEQQGYPAVITDCAEDDRQPCRKYFYKRPEAIPDEYFERVGCKKEPRKFRRMSEGDSPLHPTTLISW